MARINLQLNFQPSFVETVIRFKAKAGHYVPKTGFIDTGATVSLFPLSLLDEDVEIKVLESDIEIEQAGIAQQYFKGIEAIVRVYFEDSQGNVSEERDIRAWFAETDKIIIGFQDILEDATIFVDYRKTRTGWIEFD